MGSDSCEKNEKKIVAFVVNQLKPKTISRLKDFSINRDQQTLLAFQHVLSAIAPSQKMMNILDGLLPQPVLRNLLLRSLSIIESFLDLEKDQHY